MQTMAKAEKHTTAQDQVPAWVLDLLLGLTVTLVIALVITADQGGRQEPDLLAYAFAAGFGGLMLARRHFPVLVLILTMLLLFVYYALGYPAIGLAVPVSAALYSGAEAGRLGAAIIVSLLLMGVSTYFRILDGQSLAFLLGYELISAATMMAAAIALGDSMRARRALRAEQEQTARLIAQEHAYLVEQRVQAERVRMARDLHDTVGHSIAVIALHAAVAQEAIGQNDAEARQALAHIRTATSESMRDLRATVKVLRNPSEQPDRAITTLANLPTLVNQAEASGLTVTVTQGGALDQLPATVATAAYRIVQEALTNVIRHANATQVVIAIQAAEQALHIQVSDNGRTAPVTITPGSGIVGMTERARLLGGSLSTEQQPSGGVIVRALLPVAEGQ